MSSPAQRATKTVCVHRKARFDYDILDRFEAGMVLSGPEVKALREGKGNLVDAYVKLDAGRPPVLVNFEISPYTFDQTGRSSPRRERVLLMKRIEIERLAMRLRESGLTLVPLQVYFRGPWAKVEVAIAKGRKKADQRQALRAREDDRAIQQALRRR